MTTKVEELLRLSHAAADGMAVEELAALAQDALEPDSDMDTILHRPTQEDPSATAITGMRSAGWVTVYNKFTGDASTINRNMLTMQLTKLDDQGRRVFTTVRPTGPDGEYLKPHVGTYLCPLHKDHENRAEAERLGLPVCKKSNLVSRFQVERHAANRHPDEMAALKEIETRAREDEERLVRRAIIKQAGM
ncbi:MAG: hypothetical protein O3B65_03015, partial [Chloroflexi bacterium]|nr:hypothetical protein [Chloroflexota bacterium]